MFTELTQTRKVRFLILRLVSDSNQTPLSQEDLFWSAVVDILFSVYQMHKLNEIASDLILAFKWWLNEPFLCAVLQPQRVADPCPEWKTGAMKWRPRKCDQMSGVICIGQLPLLIFKYKSDLYYIHDHFSWLNIGLVCEYECTGVIDSLFQIQKKDSCGWFSSKRQKNLIWKVCDCNIFCVYISKKLV